MPPRMHSRMPARASGAAAVAASTVVGTVVDAADVTTADVAAIDITDGDTPARGRAAPDAAAHRHPAMRAARHALPFLLALACLLLPPLPALAELAVPPLTGHVTDQTGTLTGEQKAALEQTLTAFEARKGSQLAVLLVASTAPESIEQYSLRVVEKWKLGRKKVDDGALLLVAKGDRAMRIEVGYGLEGALNDATAKRIIAEVITPPFKQGDFYRGISAGVDSMIRVVDGEPLPPVARSNGARGTDAAPGNSFSDLESYLPIALVLAVVVGGVLRSMFGRFPGALITGGLTAVLAWLFIGGLAIAVIAGAIALFVTLVSGGRGGYMGGMGGGWGGGGGGGGGGYSGGGGGFGGGGASGKW